MDVLATCGGPIILGRTGENDYTTVVFPFDGPAGASVTVFNRLPGSVSSYPVTAVEVRDGTVRWTVSSADLSVNGYGECEITYTLGDVVAKSVRYPTQVIASLDGQGDPPEGWDTWEAVFTALKAQAEAAAQTATDAAQTAESASEAIQNLSVSSTTLTPGSAATVQKTVDPETGEVSLEFGIPEGQRGGKGDTGKTPDISIGTVTTGAAGSDASATMTGTAENPVLNLTIPRGDKGKDGEDYVLTAADKAEIAQQAEGLLAPALDNKAPIIINSASGDIAHFTDGADNMPVKELTVNVEPVQAGSGDPSPDNIRPITGWTGANIHVSPTTDAADGQTYSITFPSEAGTVYGGTLDVTNGVLKVDRAMVTYDGSEKWLAYASFEGYFILESTMKSGIRHNGFSNMLKNSKSAVSGQKNCMWLGVNTQYIYVIGVYETMGSTLPDFKSYLSEHNLEIVYPLASPITYQLPPQEITTLLGTNNIWADTGDVNVEYRADTKRYIDNKIAEAIAAALNS